MKRRNSWLALIAVLAALLIWLAFVWQPQTGSGRGALLQASGDVRLEGPDGPLALSDYRGKVVVVYFGYTFCPDICPTSLSTLAQALFALTPDELAKVRSFLISVDPQRDTKDVLKIYTPFFHPSIVGISGTPPQIAQVASQFGARYMKQKPDADGQYSVDHSSLIYVVAPDGKLAASLPYGAPAKDIVAAIRALLGQAK